MGKWIKILKVLRRFLDHSEKNSKISLNISTKIRYKLNVIVLGGSGVGKTSLINRFLYRRFNFSHDPTVEDLHHMEHFATDKRSYQLEILDTSGTYQFPEMNRLAISKADCFIIVFDVTRKDSFEEAIDIQKDIYLEKGRSSNIPLMIVANKIDREFATDMVLMENSCLVPASAKMDVNIDVIFQMLLNKI